MEKYLVVFVLGCIVGASVNQHGCKGTIDRASSVAKVGADKAQELAEQASAEAKKAAAEEAKKERKKR